MPNIRVAVNHFRNFSGYDESHSVGEGYVSLDGDNIHLGY